MLDEAASRQQTQLSNAMITPTRQHNVGHCVMFLVSWVLAAAALNSKLPCAAQL